MSVDTSANPQTTPHPSRSELMAYGLGRLDAASAEAVYQHLEKCSECRTQVEGTEDDTLASLVREAVTPPEDGAAATHANRSLLEEGVLQGHPRYQVEALLGAGGMGVVYRARHQIMERTVALKVIHRKLTENPPPSSAFAVRSRPWPHWRTRISWRPTMPIRSASATSSSWSSCPAPPWRSC